MKKSKKNCPKCGEFLFITNGDQLYCDKCIQYKVKGKWMKVWYDEFIKTL